METAFTTLAGQGELAALSHAERDVLDTVLRVLERCDAGFDDQAAAAISDALAGHVPFDRLAVSLADEGDKSFRIFGQSEGRGQRVFKNGATVNFDATAEGLESPPGAVAPPIVVEAVGERGTPLDRALFAGGVRSYVTIPVQTRGGRAWLSMVHMVPGAPSKAHLPLLSRVAAALGPAFERARVALRGRLSATLLDASPDGMIALDLTHVVRDANRAALKLCGKTRAEVIGQPLDFALGAEPARIISDSLASVSEPTPAAIVLDSGGHELHVDVVVGQVSDPSGEASFYVHLRDARGRRSVEEAMSRRLEHLSFLRALGESLGSDLRVQLAVERALDVCMARRPISGIAALRADDAGTLRLTAARGLAPELAGTLAWIRRDQLEALREEGAWTLVVTLSHARRTWGALLVLGRENAPLLDSERELWNSVGSTVSAAVHSAQDFEHVVELEAEKRLLVDSLPVIVARVEPSLAWSTSFVNGAVERILGASPSELRGLPGLDGMLDPHDRDLAMSARERASRGLKGDWEERRYRHKDGRALTLREYVYPVNDVDGTVRSVQVIAYDVTTEIESRRRLLQADRLASLGALAAGVAHEINNPVAFIGLAASQIPRQTDPSRIKELSQEVCDAADRIALIVGELKLFTRIPDGASTTPLDVNRILETAVTLTSAEIRRRARLDVSLGALPLVPGRYSGVGQAFVNLLLYGAQAVERAPAGRARVVSVTSGAETGRVVVRFVDAGPGIEPAHLPWLFDPFYPTGTQPGGGLGLAIAYDIVRRAGGDIRVNSSPEGTTFEVTLALDAADTPGEARVGNRLITFEKPALSERPGAGTRHRVLVIDDELALAKALARQLAARYDVDTASTAADALAQLSIHAYDAVVCDLRMPDQSGPSIYDAIRARSAAQASRFIFTTGGSYGASDDEIHERARACGRPILEKPFDGQTFEAAVADVAARIG